MLHPNCLDCVNFSRWQQPSGGTIPRCSEHPEMEIMIREEISYWNVSGRWASTWEADVIPTVPFEGDDVLEQSEDADVVQAIQDYLDSRLVIIDTPERPVYRRLQDIEEDVLWKMQRCSDFRQRTEAEEERERVHVENFVSCTQDDRPRDAQEFPLEPLILDEDPEEDFDIEAEMQRHLRRERNLAGYAIKAALEGKAVEPILKLWDVVQAACP